MDISHKSVLKKMEEELQRAGKAEGNGAMKQHVYTIRTLCDMLLDAQGDGSIQIEAEDVSKPVLLRPEVPQTVQPAVHQPNKISTDDGANGDSIFDF